MSWERLRTIVEELDVSNQVDLYSETFPRFNEAWEGLKWLLCRNPEPKGVASWVGEGVYRAYALAADHLAGTPEIWTVYTYTDTEVIVLGVQAKAVTESEDE